MLGDFGLSKITGAASKPQYSLPAWGSSLPLETTLSTAQKMKFPLKISPVNVTKSVTFTEEIFNGKLHFCKSGNLGNLHF